MIYFQKLLKVRKILKSVGIKMTKNGQNRRGGHVPKPVRLLGVVGMVVFSCKTAVCASKSIQS